MKFKELPKAEKMARIEAAWLAMFKETEEDKGNEEYVVSQCLATVIVGGDDLQKTADAIFALRQEEKHDE